MRTGRGGVSGFPEGLPLRDSAGLAPDFLTLSHVRRERGTSTVAWGNVNERQQYSTGGGGGNRTALPMPPAMWYNAAMEATVYLRRTAFLAWLDEVQQAEKAEARAALEALAEAVRSLPQGHSPLVALGRGAEDDLTMRRDLLLRYLDQAAGAYTDERRRHYLRRLRQALTEVRTSAVNEINLNRWQEYDEVWTDSLWLIEGRDRSGAHLGWYWGNFVPQIPRQLMLRYTRRGDRVLDPFLGSGTTLIECRRLGRHGVGVELVEAVAQKARALIEQEPNPHGVETSVLVGDATALPLAGRFQLVVMHPPYHDILRFSEDARDLSNAPTVEDYLARWRQAVAQVAPLLERGRYLAVVIGDKYVRGEWVPLGFRVMEATMEAGFSLKSIVVKNFETTRGKRSQEALWRYRALAGGFYLFKHEYIFILRKR